MCLWRLICSKKKNNNVRFVGDMEITERSALLALELRLQRLEQRVNLFETTMSFIAVKSLELDKMIEEAETIIESTHREPS